jgi:hypothetical protein
MCFRPLFTIKTVKLVVGVKNPNHMGEKSHRSRGGVGFLGSDLFYSVFCFRDPTLLDLVTEKKGSNAKECS